MNTFTGIVVSAVPGAGALSIAYADLPDPGMEIVEGRTALLITDPQNDFLSSEGVAWGVVGKNATENNTVENIETLMKAADGLAAAMVNYRFIASTVWTTQEADILNHGKSSSR